MVATRPTVSYFSVVHVGHGISFLPCVVRKWISMSLLLVLIDPHNLQRKHATTSKNPSPGSRPSVVFVEFFADGALPDFLIEIGSPFRFGKFIQLVLAMSFQLRYGVTFAHAFFGIAHIFL